MITNLKDKKILKIADSIIKDYKLCDYCVGRIFAKIETGIDNKKRGWW